MLPLLLHHLHVKGYEISFDSHKERFDIEAEGVINNAYRSGRRYQQCRQALERLASTKSYHWSIISRSRAEEPAIHILINKENLEKQGDLTRLCDEILGEIDDGELLSLIEETIPRKFMGANLQFTEIIWHKAT